MEADDSLLPETTYFDFLVWAMEAMHAFRAEYPLTWAMPWSLLVRREDGLDPVRGAIDPEMVWAFAPLYSAGREFGTEPRLSQHFGVWLALDLMGVHILRQLPTGAGVLRLDGFPEELTEDEGLSRLLVPPLCALTGCDELDSWELHREVEASGTVHEEEEVKEPSPRHVSVTTSTRIDIGRAEVERADSTRAVAELEALRTNPIAHRFSVRFTFSGFSGRALGVWDFPKVREFFADLRRTCPYWPWYVSVGLDPHESLGLLLFFASGLENPRKFALDDLREFLIEAYHGLNSEADRIHLGEEELKAMSSDLLNAVQNLARKRLE